MTGNDLFDSMWLAARTRAPQVRARRANTWFRVAMLVVVVLAVVAL